MGQRRNGTWLLTAIAAVLVVLAMPAATFAATASRTWVSGVGDDANASGTPPCSRTAPCKTFAAAISVTTPGGEIDVLDPGGFGAVTITKSITINATGVTAGVLVSGTNGILVSAGSTDTVILRGLDLDGLVHTTPPPSSPSIDGVHVTTAGTVRIENSLIYGFGSNGINFAPTNPGSKLSVENTSIHDNNGDGVLVDPPNGGSATVTLTNDELENNACGVVATSLGTSGPFTTSCGTPATGGGTAAGATALTATNSSASGNAGAGVLSNGAGASSVIGGDIVTGNATGLQELNGGAIESLGGNEVFGNGSDGSPTSASNVFVGPAGPQGPVGPKGILGAAGPGGPRGKVDLVNCKTVVKTRKVHGHKRKVTQQQCSGKLVPSPVKFSATGTLVRASLSRSGKTYASGTARDDSGGLTLALTSVRRMSTGSYTLTLLKDKRLLARETVTIGLTGV